MIILSYISIFLLSILILLHFIFRPKNTNLEVKLEQITAALLKIESNLKEDLRQIATKAINYQKKIEKN